MLSETLLTISSFQFLWVVVVGARVVVGGIVGRVGGDFFISLLHHAKQMMFLFF